MKIHEYQAKELLKAYGLPVPLGFVVTTPEEAKVASQTLGAAVLKAQVHSGGRGKAGGVKLAKNPDEAFDIASNMLGMKLVTKQTGPEGKIVRKILVTEVCQPQKEYYLCVTGDDEHAGLMIVASAEGGTEIEETAIKHPERIIKIPVSVIEGLQGNETLQLAEDFKLSLVQSGELQSILAGMVKLYIEKDCSLVEINPLVLGSNNHLEVLDAKITFDDNALFRHPELLELMDVDEEDPKEYKATKHGLSYVTLDGNIGCLVNGAGLAMATMDIIKNFGGHPANFLDVGGSATAEKVKTAFEILLSDTNVKAIFINIFGGIMKCDTIATGVVAATKEIGIKIPVIVRLEGTNIDLGRQILNESGLKLISALDMADGARKAIKAASESSL